MKGMVFRAAAAVMMAGAVGCGDALFSGLGSEGNDRPSGFPSQISLEGRVVDSRGGPVHQAHLEVEQMIESNGEYSHRMSGDTLQDGTYSLPSINVMDAAGIPMEVGTFRVTVTPPTNELVEHGHSFTVRKGSQVTHDVTLQDSQAGLRRSRMGLADVGFNIPRTE